MLTKKNYAPSPGKLNENGKLLNPQTRQERRLILQGNGCKLQGKKKAESPVDDAKWAPPP